MISLIAAERPNTIQIVKSLDKLSAFLGRQPDASYVHDDQRQRSEKYHAKSSTTRQMSEQQQAHIQHMTEQYERFARAIEKLNSRVASLSGGPTTYKNFCK
jgi:predicted RNase H-like nuclease (RuvC/YqgF family)